MLPPTRSVLSELIEQEPHAVKALTSAHRVVERWAWRVVFMSTPDFVTNSRLKIRIPTSTLDFCMPFPASHRNLFFARVHSIFELGVVEG